MAFYGEKPVDAAFYAVDHQRKYEFIAWAPPPPPGDELCRSLTGRSEAEFVKAILDGRYNHLFEGGAQ